MTSKIFGNQIADYTIDTKQLSNTITSVFATSAEVANFTASLAPRITSVNVANSMYTVLDDTSVNVGGGYIVITGTNFQDGVTVKIDTSLATSVTRSSSTELRVQVPAKSAASYALYVVNPDGGTGIKVNGLTYSSFPGFSTSATLPSAANNTSFAVSISASSDSSITYSNTTSLPAGATLLANGYFYGTVSIPSTTTYSFDVKATDAELQDTSRTFGLTVSVNQLWATGGNYGVLGLNDSGATNRSSPVQVGTGTNWANTSIVNGTSLATKADGTLWTWGQTAYGSIGLNDAVQRSSPVQIGTGTNWKTPSSGWNHMYATKTDGTLWAWGYNANGQLSTGDKIDRSSPVQVGTLTNWNMVAAGYYAVIATKTDGTLWTWGRGGYGEMGIGVAGNPTGYRSSPVQVGTDTNWAWVAQGQQSMAAIKTTGTLWTWGLNSSGQLGNGGVIARSSPTQVGALTNWSKITLFQSAMAIKTDGTLWAWGASNFGQVPDSSNTNRSSPVQIGSGTSWSEVSSVYSYGGVALKTDGTAWVWGYSPSGDLGPNIVVGGSVASPVQFDSATNWSKLPAGECSRLLMIKTA